jgi:hypothetical protein
MSWSRKGVLIGAILGPLVMLFTGGNQYGGGPTLWHLLLGAVLGALGGWVIGKVIAK